MHPAFSVIFFTVVSGCGYGLLFLLALAALADPALFARVAPGALGLGTTMIIAGLLSSTLHLGQPQRAWRAFSQWRSSWLSREGVVAVISFVPLVALGWCWWRGADAAALRASAGALVLVAVGVVFCTAKIYTTLKTIPAWHDPLVLPGYLLLALLGGEAWFVAIRTAVVGFEVVTDVLAFLAIATFAAWLKISYWHRLSSNTAVATIETATGLGRFGAVRSVEAPHTEENYLTREMGFALARKHAQRLRQICIMLIAAIPVLLLCAAYLVRMPLLEALAACAAALSVTGGLFVERWLFFAEAKHVVMLYYAPRDAQRA